jgi:hypothetical protein
MKTVAIVQSNYIPWKGYFDMVAKVDEFILFDDVQYTRRDWRNRNKIKTPAGPSWLTIPVIAKGRYDQRICDTAVDHSSRWTHKHLNSIRHHYARAPFLAMFADDLAALYEQAEATPLLSHINHLFIRWVCQVLRIDTTVTWSMDYPGEGSKTDRLLTLCQAAGATGYLSGPAARTYIETEKFTGAGIELSYMDYDGYRPYPQLHGDFIHEISVLDLILNLGPDARQYLNHAKPL